MQKQVAQIQAQAAVAGKSREAVAKEREKELRAKEKAEDEKRRKEEAALIKPVQMQKVPFGVDPKTVLCAFFKAGHCDKGSKCKFSHDPDVGRKVDKRNLYGDNREDKLAGTLQSLALSFFNVWYANRYDGQMGRGEATECHLIQARKSTDNDRRRLALVLWSIRDLTSFLQIVCKYFIEAVETQK